jgi:predicted ester cyclase
MEPEALKSLLSPFRQAAASFTASGVRDSLRALLAPDAAVRMCHPFGDLTGPDGFFDACHAPLLTAMPDLERRDMIVMAGATDTGEQWIGAMGNWMGTFAAPFLGIPPTGHLAHMRYHEFYRVEGGRVGEVQAIWDIPELMMQAGAWPMAPQLGAFLCTPGPMSGDGLDVSGDGSEALQRVVPMLEDMVRHPADPDPAAMRLDAHWHPRFNWYGPAGIGTGRGVHGFRNCHQIPFLAAMPDRGRKRAGTDHHFLAQGDYVAVTGWPNMRQTLTGDGWMGIAPAGREVTLRSLDFWRLEGGLIRENWVLVDLLDLYRQIGVDVLARLDHFKKARNLANAGASR